MAPEAQESLAADVILLAENSNLPGRVKQTAAETSEQLRLGRWRPVQTVQHSDLWMGNIMYAPRGSAWSFSVIDWAGATVNGFPFFDFCRFCLSCSTSAHLTRRKLLRLLAALELEHDAVVPHVLCSLARMQRNLENFPEELFCEMVAQTTRFAFDLAEGVASDYRQG
ncbi:DUF1679 domain-containing protein [Sulfitobacter sp. JBTF-M27]|uniref:DUF1679 domain-containing protein n=1 Tax=Sulfitobacter sediminilitoris TaxID=2698830 RepID=A0A6P0CIL7_9RHOB|nr:DUF1679 domain-containing protein [Sulfitobacter sediminilitoris]NEK25250.1 DUF1679 domain-containing protein [Sulfitobacter sediminilitoris]